MRIMQVYVGLRECAAKHFLVRLKRSPCPQAQETMRQALAILEAPEWIQAVSAFLVLRFGLGMFECS